MKIAQKFIILSLIMILGCAAHKDAPVKKDIIPDWRLGYDHLRILETALEQMEEPDQYALHSVDDPMLTANIIAKIWHFSWDGGEYEIAESDYFVRAEHSSGDSVQYEVLNYMIHSKDGDFVMELEKSDSSEEFIQFLVRPANGGIVVDIFDSGETERKVYEKLPMTYGYSNKRLRSLSHLEEFSYCTFGMDSLDITILRNKAMREGDILKIIARQDNGDRTEMHLNDDMEVIYMNSEGLEFEKCSIDTALSER